jgi:hypothetical protein
MDIDVLTASIDGFIQEEQEAIAAIEAEVGLCLRLEDGEDHNRITRAVLNHGRGIPSHRAAIAAYSNIRNLLHPQTD